MVRNHFIQGVRSSSIQLKLMREMPATLADAVRLASQQETVESAAKELNACTYNIGTKWMHNVICAGQVRHATRQTDAIHVTSQLSTGICQVLQ